MKVVAFNGSPRRDGNTSILIGRVFDELKNAGIETEIVQLRGKKLPGCIACYKCFKNLDKRCGVKNDDMNGCIEKMLDADGILAMPNPVRIGVLSCFTRMVSGLRFRCRRSTPTGLGP